MSISVFDLFSIGIGPSSSHTVGPMRAAKAFMQEVLSRAQTQLRIEVTLYGSLALTGVGHGTDIAILNGLAGFAPELIDPAAARPFAEQVRQTGMVTHQSGICFPFNPKTQLIILQKELLPKHTNGMLFRAFQAENLIASQIYYSIGGGFIVTDEQFGVESAANSLPYPFSTADELFGLCQRNQLSIAELMISNEQTLRAKSEIETRLLTIASTMKQCIEAGCKSTATSLPGRLNVRRRAPGLYQKLLTLGIPLPDSQTDMMNWLNLYAIAVNEENAAGGRVVTAPTNGAAGIIPSVLNYYVNYHKNATDAKIMEFLLTAGAIAILYKKGASISGAEVGCQGEVGVACSMAAGALTAVLGGNLVQIENAAEIAMEHHLGMTCDPIDGLVQIPCIERNAMGAVKAVNAARLALMETEKNKVSLDKIIATMKQTGHDMMTIYKETSLGGLAVNVPEC